MARLASVQHPGVRDNLLVVTVFVAALSLVTATVGVGFGLRALDENRSGRAASGSVEPVAVSLTEYAITPVSVASGGSLTVTNDGTAAHNLVVEGTGAATAELASGASASLTLSGVAPGKYTMFCNIAGHRAAGMAAELRVTEKAAPVAAPAGQAGHAWMDYAAMTAAMVKTMGMYPATTKGVGNPLLQPTTTLADGTKVFDLVAEIVDWERAPGDTVKAWTYNGVVPAPTVRLVVGDRAQFRLRNKLPIATDLHLHGLNVENRFDGVAPLTQKLIEPGQTFTYDYVADEVAVAMYHPHFHSQIGLPNGMFGTIFVGQMPLPRGRSIGGESIPTTLAVTQEFPMVLNDAGVIGYSLNGKSFPATAPVVGATGDWVLFHYFNEGTQIHPMHLHQFDQVVIAKDGFALDAPFVADTLNVAPGERYSVLVHLDKPGTWVWHCHILPHVEGEKGMFGMVTAVVVK